MSFVLQALKKQEAGGDPDAAVALERLNFERQRHRLWAGLFAAAMVVNVVVLVWVFAGQRSSTSEPAPAADPAVAPGVATAAPPAVDTGSAVPAASELPTLGSRDSAATAGAPPAADAGAGNRAPAATRAPARPRARPPAPVFVTLQALPAEARARFPGLAFSTHIYGEDADLRAIVANGERLQEGDRIRGLEIVEITETGVVLAFEHYRVSVPIVADR